MQNYIALLRGINVSGQKLIRMKDLVQLLESAGLKQVQNYIQSGNIAFQSSEQCIPVLVDSIQGAIKKEYGFDVPTQILTPGKLKQVIEQNPFLARPDFVENKMYVTFLDALPATVPEVGSKAKGNDEYVIDGDVIYSYLVQGAGKTKLTNTYWETLLKVNSTSRNWRTTLKLYEMVKQ